MSKCVARGFRSSSLTVSWARYFVGSWAMYANSVHCHRAQKGVVHDGGVRCKYCFCKRGREGPAKGRAADVVVCRRIKT